jgi:hypothetical protein
VRCLRLAIAVIAELAAVADRSALGDDVTDIVGIARARGPVHYNLCNRHLTVERLGTGFVIYGKCETNQFG